MSSVVASEEIERLKNKYLSPDENGDVSFEIKNPQNDFESTALQIENNDLQLKLEETEGKYDSDAALGDVIVEKKKNEGDHNEIKPSQVRKTVIGSLGALIEVIGETLSSEDMDEIIKEDVNCEGNVDLLKLLDILEKEIDQESKINDSCSDANKASVDNVHELRRRMNCIGIITKTLGKNLTEEDIQDMLAEDLNIEQESGTVDFAKLLTLMEKKMKEFPMKNNSGDEMFKLEDNEEISLQEIKSVMSALGTVMITLGQTLTDDEFRRIMKREYPDGNFDFPKLLLNVMEKELIEAERETDIIKDFRVFDPDNTGYIYVDEFCQVMTSMGDKFNEKEMEEFLDGIEINEHGQFNYVDYVNKMTLKRY